jgi:hypothetical protein
MSFLENICLDTSKFVENVDGMAYLSWPMAVSLAKHPEHSLVQFGQKPFLEIFGGAVVAVDIDEQRTWLPILDKQNKPINLPYITSRDVSDTYQRCRTKAIAMARGIGLSLYAGYDGDGHKFGLDLGLREDSDLVKAKPIVSTKRGKIEARYLDWATALAAAKITDNSFHWEVGMHQNVDKTTGEVVSLPYMQVIDTYMVSVTVTYKGVRHTEWLPIMGVLPVKTKNGEKKMDYQPLTTPTVFDWNRSVMRCLAKAISVATGYGLSIYAGEDLVEAKSENSSAGASDLTEIRELLKMAGKEEAAMCAWLGVSSLEEADQESILKAENVLRKAIEKNKKAA